MHVLEHSCIHGMPVSKRWRCHSGSCGPASASGATLRVGLGDQPFSGSTFSLSTLVSTWAVPTLTRQDSASQRLLQASAHAHLIDTGALSCNLRSGSDAAPGRERELARKSLDGGGSPFGAKPQCTGKLRKIEPFSATPTLPNEP